MRGAGSFPLLHTGTNRISLENKAKRAWCRQAAPLQHVFQKKIFSKAVGCICNCVALPTLRCQTNSFSFHRLAVGTLFNFLLKFLASRSKESKKCVRPHSPVRPTNSKQVWNSKLQTQLTSDAHVECLASLAEGLVPVCFPTQQIC